jgi:hypothetical protein
MSADWRAKRAIAELLQRSANRISNRQFADECTKDRDAVAKGCSFIVGPPPGRDGCHCEPVTKRFGQYFRMNFWRGTGRRDRNAEACGNKAYDRCPFLRLLCDHWFKTGPAAHRHDPVSER